MSKANNLNDPHPGFIDPDFIWGADAIRDHIQFPGSRAAMFGRLRKGLIPGAKKVGRGFVLDTKIWQRSFEQTK